MMSYQPHRLTSALTLWRLMQDTFAQPLQAHAGHFCSACEGSYICIYIYVCFASFVVSLRRLMQSMLSKPLQAHTYIHRGILLSLRLCKILSKPLQAHTYIFNGIRFQPSQLIQHVFFISLTVFSFLLKAGSNFLFP